MYRMINGVEVDVTTVMEKGIKYTPTETESRNMIEEVSDLLQEYFPNIFDRYAYNTGLHNMFDTDGEFWERKGWLINAFAKHPFYNGNFQIVLRDEDMSRKINSADIYQFSQYVHRITRKYMFVGDMHWKYKGKVVTAKELSEMRNKYYYLLGRATDLNIPLKYHICDLYRETGTRSVEEVTSKTEDNVLDALSIICDCVVDTRNHIVSEDLAQRINMIFSDEPKPVAVAGQKVSRLVGKLAKMIGINNHTDIQTQSWVDDHGVLHERQKDVGWNYQYAKFCDAVNPILIKGTAVISVNPMDYYTMSFGSNWASCHTIDKENRRCSSNNYSGCYCGGTQSYMLDNSSVIFYFLPQDFEGDQPELEDKVKRCVFFLGEDKLIQSRVYPDGRDGGEDGLATTIRNIMQKTVAELFDVPNYWQKVNGTSECNSVIYSHGAHYRDYVHYSDCNVSYMKRIDGFINREIIDVGADGICPICGERHGNEETIFCADCWEEKVYCEQCGCAISRDDARYIGDGVYCDDCTFYCEECGEYYLNDDANEVYRRINSNYPTYVCGSCLDSDYVWCGYDDRYIRYDNVTETEDGNYYGNGSDGYGYCCECGSAYSIDMLTEIDGRYYCEDCIPENDIDVEEDWNE